MSEGVEFDAAGPLGSDTLDFEAGGAAEEEGKGAGAVEFKDRARARRERDLCPTCTSCMSEANTERRKEIKRVWMKRVWRDTSIILSDCLWRPD